MKVDSGIRNPESGIRNRNSEKNSQLRHSTDLRRKTLRSGRNGFPRDSRAESGRPEISIRVGAGSVPRFRSKARALLPKSETSTTPRRCASRGPIQAEGGYIQLQAGEIE